MGNVAIFLQRLSQDSVCSKAPSVEWLTVDVDTLVVVELLTKEGPGHHAGRLGAGRCLQVGLHVVVALRHLRQDPAHHQAVDQKPRGEGGRSGGLVSPDGR